MWYIKETNTLRHGLKHKLSNYGWYHNSYVIGDFEGYAIVVEVTKIDDFVKKVVPSWIKSTNVKLQLSNKVYAESFLPID
jgi:hypothetical protein